MSDVLQNLADNLMRQVVLLEEFIHQEKDKQKALIKNNLPQIDAITAQEERLILQANGLEKERLLWTAAIGREHGKTAEDLTLAKLAEYFPG